SNGDRFPAIADDAFYPYFPDVFYVSPLFYLPRATGFARIEDFGVEVNSLDIADNPSVPEWDGLLYIFFELGPTGQCDTGYRNMRMKGVPLLVTHPDGTVERPWPWA